MRRDFRKLAVVCVLMLLAAPVFAQSIAFSPSAPKGGDTVVATLTQPFNCSAQMPVLSTGPSGSITLDTVLPYGIVHCPFIPVPEPLTTVHTVTLGALPSGTYAVTWNISLGQPSGDPMLLTSTSASLVVAPGVTANGAAVLDPLPALSTWALVALAGLCALFGLRRKSVEVRRR